jgi:hypothetical protein
MVMKDGRKGSIRKDATSCLERGEWGTIKPALSRRSCWFFIFSSLLTAEIAPVKQLRHGEISIAPVE